MTEIPPPTYDPQTLREVFEDDDAVRRRIADLPRRIARASDIHIELLWRGELTTLLRSTDQLDDALNEARAALDRAEIAGEPAQQHIARVRLAKVFAWRGEFAESTLSFMELGADAWHYGPLVDAYTHEEAGMNDFAQGHWADAAEHFEVALRLRSDVGTDTPPEWDPARFGLAAARARLDEEPDS